MNTHTYVYIYIYTFIYLGTGSGLLEALADVVQEAHEVLRLELPGRSCKYVCIYVYICVYIYICIYT